MGWIAGAPWPKGDEDKAFAVSRAWSEAATELRALQDEVSAAKDATARGYLAGEGRVEMLARFDELAAGEQSLESLAAMCEELSDAAFDMGTQIQSAKLNIIVTLAWLAVEIMLAWVFPPRAALPRFSCAIPMTARVGVPWRGMAGEADLVPSLRRTLRQGGQR